eukprot:1564134-Pleurochrysis_carterae.AAC.2
MDQKAVTADAKREQARACTHAHTLARASARTHSRSHSRTLTLAYACTQTHAQLTLASAYTHLQTPNAFHAAYWYERGLAGVEC